MSEHTTEFKVGKGYTNNDGNYCEFEITLLRIAERYKGQDEIYGDANHEEFELHIQTPYSMSEDNDAEENEEGGFIEKLTVSRRNLIELRAMLNGLNLDTDTPTYENGEDFR